MKTLNRKILSAFLTVALLLSIMPLNVLPVLATDGVPYIDESGNVQTCKTATAVMADDNKWGVDDENEYWYVISGEMTILSRVIVEGDVHLILADGASLNMCEGIEVNRENSLTIYAQTTGEQMGTLTANGGKGRAGIGGSYLAKAGDITINGGNVIAQGGDDNPDNGGAAGIGGGDNGASGSITINSGNVMASGGWRGAGIGGGGGGDGGNIAINGGIVQAEGRQYAAGIGGGMHGAGGHIVINDGTVKATGGVNAADIGGGDNGDGGTIIILGGTVEANSNESGGAGIGGGNGGESGNIIITGGTVMAAGSNYAAGIGGGAGINGSGGAGGSITISGGTVTATGGNYAAGIGSGGNRNGDSGKRGSITINGGTVMATGGDYGAGIGGGQNGDGGTIIINGGNIIAQGGDFEGMDWSSLGGAAGIGGGDKGDGGEITIKGGCVTATGGAYSAGIGGGNGYGDGGKGNGGIITISGGSVTANGSQQAAGIGGGCWGEGGTITIEGGTVTATGGVSGSGIGGGDAGDGGTFSTGDDGQAVIVASSISDHDDKGSWNGIIIEGNNGQLYGSSVTPTENFTIPADTTLTIPEDATLTINEDITMTNEGTIINKGTISGKIDGNQPLVPVTGVSLDKTSLTLIEGEREQLTATVAPENATNKNVTWESSDTSVATVDANGKVTAVSAGTATITVTTEDGNYIATCTVIVEADEPPFNGHYTYPVNVAETEHGSIVLAKEDRYAADGEEVSFTVVPDDGYATDSVSVTSKSGKDVTVTDEGEGIYTFTMPTSEVTLSAIFVEAEEPEPTPELPFTDVSENDWFYNPVRWAFLEGLMTGTSDTEFSPNLATTRGMIVSVLYRLEGNPDLSDEILGYPYEDVDANDWYAMPVYWARLHGIVSGYSDTKFGPNDAITREQLAAILMNYADYKGMDVSQRADLSAYSDADTISAWATDTMQWAVAEGLISGMTADTLAPKGSGTRAQVAAVFWRYLEA